ncbi:DUF937 domain-containing protein [Gaetbulibacter saemankumensis]|uniref:DUF937 domain-containing protein n=1 Tax=Gaetbulibacter saemankumensis TaxID=311208 RepID=UPI0003F50AFA|nr:DUF937 domain-containing protein [Gaetbulibacter saemankumensis]
MSGILDLLNSDLGQTIINGVSNQTKQPKNKTQDVLTMALPVLMQAMRNNASNPEGAQGILNAISNKHDGSILDNLDGLFSGGISDTVMSDGGNILNHILGNKQQHIETALGAKSGIDSNTVAQILKIAAPIVMGLLGNQAKQNKVTNSSGLEGLLGNLVNTNSKNQEQSFIETILDADGDGSVIDDVANMVLGGNKKKSGLGGMLGGLFGNK